MKKITIITALAVTLLACAREERVAGPLVFRADLGEITKAEFNAGKISWEAGDVIRIGNGSACTDVTLASSDITPDGRTATFSVSGLAAADNYYAVFPASSCGSGLTLSGGDIVITPAASQNAGNVFTCVSTCSADDLSLTFHNPMALVYVTTTYSAVHHVTLRSINGGSLAGSISVNPSTGESAWETEGATSVTAAVSDKKAFMEIPPLGYFTGGLALDIYDADDNLMGTVIRNGRRSVERNKYYTLATGTLSGVPVATVGETGYTNFASAITAFNEGGGILTYCSDYSSAPVITATSGTIDMAGNSQTTVIWMQNASGSVTIRNGTFTSTGDCFDGKTGFNDGYAGEVVLENMTVNGILWTDSHPFVIRSGSYNIIRNMRRNAVENSGTVTITGGSFKDFSNYSSSGWSYGDYIISGGKFAFNPSTKTNVTIVEGYSIVGNTGSDAAVYPYMVVAD